MTAVAVLHEPTYSRNAEGFLFPLKYNRKRLLEHGVRLSFSTDLDRAPECDVLCVSSRCFRTWWTDAGGDAVLEWLARARRTSTRIYWFDISDSTGTTQFHVLPSVDGYVKNQVLRDRTQYQKSFYGMRMATDFYHRRFQITDDMADEPHLNEIPQTAQLHKIHVGWNFGMANHDANGHQLGRIWHRADWLPRWYPRRWSTPSASRAVACSCRIGTSYPRETVAYPRKRVLGLVKGRMSTERISRRAYFAELRQSVAAITPFGLGEVCYRDFEIVMSGAAMVKPDMGHLETWPDLWVNGSTYLPYAWDFSDFDATLQHVLDNPARVAELASNAQQRYRRLLTTEEGHHEFCRRFHTMVESPAGTQAA